MILPNQAHTYLLCVDLADEALVAEANDLTLDIDRRVDFRELERGSLHDDDVVVRLLPLPAPLLLAAAAALRAWGLPLLACLDPGGPDALRTAPLDILDLGPVLVLHLGPHLVGIVAGAGALPAAAPNTEVINAKTHTQPRGDIVGLFALLAARADAEVERDADLARDLGVLGAIGRWPLLWLLLLSRLLLLRILDLLLFLSTLLLFWILLRFWTLWLFWALLLFWRLLLLLALLFLGKVVRVGCRHEGGVSGLVARGADEALLDGGLYLILVHEVDSRGGEMGKLALVGRPVALADQAHAAEVEAHERRQHMGVPG